MARLSIASATAAVGMAVFALASAVIGMMQFAIGAGPGGWSRCSAKARR
jgi:hypothetical protein